MHPEAIAELIISGCDNAERDVRAALAAAPGIVRAGLDAIRIYGLPLPGWAKDAAFDLIMEAVNRAADVMLEAIDMLRLLAKSVGRPSLLREAATQIATAVTAAGATLGSAMTMDVLGAADDDAWDSPASDSYQAAFSEQVRDVDRVEENGRALENVLNDVAASLDSFFAELNWAYLGLVIAVVGLVAAIATAPTGIGPIIGLIASVIGVLISIGSVIMAFTNSSSRNAGIADRLASSPALDWTRSAFAS
ncbi:hypothetical protein [Microbacterium sp. 18062]|uniref:hypothetical protein n=1 Tax=Microbacterium sp. 18062 TaxID=2681410 RepID=UPI00135A8498|nr:hypothetical protein [Microbacterium sp. 18062]